MRTTSFEVIHENRYAILILYTEIWSVKSYEKSDYLWNI